MMNEDNAVKESNTSETDQPNMDKECHCSNNEHNYGNGGKDYPMDMEKNVFIKSEAVCPNTAYGNHSSRDHKFDNADYSTFCTNQPCNVNTLRNLKRRVSFHDTTVKQEVVDHNSEHANLDNQPRAIRLEYLKLRNGCTNSGCNSSNQCLNTYKCNKCNSTYTDKQLYMSHFKHCSDLPSTSQSDRKDLILQHNYFERSTNSQDLQKLIEKVREHPCLYNINNNDYMNSQLKNVLWLEIAGECNFMNGISAKKAWDKLVRDFRNLYAYPRTTSSNFAYQTQMGFLLPFIHNTSQSLQLTVNEQAEPIAHVEINDISLQELVPPAKKQRIISNEPATTGIRNLCEGSSQRKTSSQPLDTFFLSMCETTKSLPNRLQIQVKKKVFQAVIEAEELAATITDTTVSNEHTTVDHSVSSEED